MPGALAHLSSNSPPAPRKPLRAPLALALLELDAAPRSRGHSPPTTRSMSARRGACCVGMRVRGAPFGSPMRAREAGRLECVCVLPFCRTHPSKPSPLQMRTRTTSSTTPPQLTSPSLLAAPATRRWPRALGSPWCPRARRRTARALRLRAARRAPPAAACWSPRWWCRPWRAARCR